MSDRPTQTPWLQAARRMAEEFDRRLGSRADEFVAFEAPRRAIAIGITLPMRLLKPEEAARFGWVLPAADASSSRLSSWGTSESGEGGLQEYAKIERTILLDEVRCVNFVQVLRGGAGECYAVHGVAAAEAEAALRADMTMVVSSLVC